MRVTKLADVCLFVCLVNCFDASFTGVSIFNAIPTTTEPQFLRTPPAHIPPSIILEIRYTNYVDYLLDVGLVVDC